MGQIGAPRTSHTAASYALASGGTMKRRRWRPHSTSSMSGAKNERELSNLWVNRMRAVSHGLRQVWFCRDTAQSVILQSGDAERWAGRSAEAPDVVAVAAGGRPGPA